MPKSSSYRAIKNAVILMADEQGYMRDISGTSNEVSPEFTNSTEAFYGFDTGKLVIESTPNDKMSIKGWASDGKYELRRLMEDWSVMKGRRYIMVTDASSGGGRRRYGGEFVLASLKFSAKADDNKPTMYEIELEPYGNIDRIWLD